MASTPAPNPDPRPPESWKVNGIREAFQNRHPEIAAEQAAVRFESDAMPIPPALVTPEGAQRWEAAKYESARGFYRTIARSGAAGVALRALRSTGREADALKFLRAQDVIAERTVRGLIVLFVEEL